jgi:hypothetical protein
MSDQPVLEKHVVARIVQALKAQEGVVVRKRHGTALGVAGDPDLYGSIAGRHFEIEVKRPGGAGRLTELQRQRLREWKDTGALAGVASCVADAMQILGISR